METVHPFLQQLHLKVEMAEKREEQEKVTRLKRKSKRLLGQIKSEVLAAAEKGATYIVYPIEILRDEMDLFRLLIKQELGIRADFYHVSGVKYATFTQDQLQPFSLQLNWKKY